VTHAPDGAGDVYAVALEPLGPVKAWSLAWAKGLVLAAAASIGWWDGAAIGDLVVRRRADGAVVIKTGAGDQEEAAQLLAHVESQLRELTAEQFEATWGIDAATDSGVAPA
jgi:hypothetical protein